jgi:vitamin B12 transporter
MSSLIRPVIIPAILLSTVLAVPFTVHAADNHRTIVVSASRTPQTANKALASVTVISRKDIEKSQAPTLLDILRLKAGIDVSRTGGKGGEISLFIRGTNSNHVLVLIDGVRVGSSRSSA